MASKIENNKVVNSVIKESIGWFNCGKIVKDDFVFCPTKGFGFWRK